MTVLLFTVSLSYLIFLINNIQTDRTVLLLEANLLVVSDPLTSNARASVNTGGISFYNTYQTEVNETQTYKRTIGALEAILPVSIKDGATAITG